MTYNRGVNVPIVIEQTNQGERQYDLFSRLLKDRIIFLSDIIDSASASVIVAQMLFLESEDPTKDIMFYISCPYGDPVSGMAIYDTMKYIRCDISTICVGYTASMGTMLLSAGTKGKRLALPNSQIMLQQPYGEAGGQASDVKIYMDWQQGLRENVNKILSETTGQSAEKIAVDTERDTFLSAKEAVEYGIIDRIIEKR